MAHKVVWFDIPVLDLDRAIHFYAAVLDQSVHRQEFPGGGAIGVIDHGSGDVAGCLYADPDFTPSAQGPLLYLNADGRLDAAIRAVEENGGRVLEPAHPIGPHGFRAVALDSEGNRVALHSQTG